MKKLTPGHPLRDQHRSQGWRPSDVPRAAKPAGPNASDSLPRFSWHHPVRSLQIASSALVKDVGDRDTDKDAVKMKMRMLMVSADVTGTIVDLATGRVKE
jgi:hypothetical protein